MKDIVLPSGVTLSLHEAPITEAHDLYQTILREFSKIGMTFDREDEKGVEKMLKDIICLGFSSKDVHRAVIACFPKCLYGTEKMSLATFDPPERRQDLVPAFAAVIEENIAPFVKGLLSVFMSYLSLAQGTSFPG